jgi:MFS family permease
LGLSIYFFLFNLFLLGHGYTEKTLGLLTSAMAVGNLAGAIPAGKLAQRFGLRVVLLSCFLLAIAVSSARAILLAFPLQLLFAFLAGIALSAWAVCLSPAVAQLTDERQRPFAFSLILSLGIGVGALGGLLGSRLPGWFASHHVLVGSLQPEQLVLLLSCCIAGFGLWPAARLTFGRADLPTRAKPFLSPFLLRFLPAIAVWSLVTGSFSPFANVYFAHHMHMTLPQIGNAFSISQVSQVVAVLVAPIIFRRWGLISGIVFTQVAASLLLIVLSAIGHPLAATAAYVGFTAFQWMNEPGLYSLLMNKIPPEERGGASAANSFTMAASQTIAAACAGAAFARYGYPSALRGIALIAIFAAALFWSMRAPPKHEPSLELDDVPS